MPKHTLYAYVDGADLHGIADSVEGRLNTFAKEGGWRTAAPFVVNQRGSEDGLRAGDLASWDLGLNLPLPEARSEFEGWFIDVERIARFLGKLHAKFERDFIIGIADNSAETAEDFFTVESDIPDLVRLRQVIGIESPPDT